MTMRKSTKNPKHKKVKTPQPKSAVPSVNQPAQIAQLAYRSAPLPLPSELESYERILPGAAERIFTMVENQSTHRQKLEVVALSAECRNSLLGIIVGGILGVFGLSISGVCIYTGMGWPGAALGGATLVSLVGTFVYGTRQRRLEREQKYQIMKKGE